jgi:polyphosphate glucokinase
MSNGFGVDIGGSGIKGAPVDLGEGRFAGERTRIETPRPSTPDAVLHVVKDVLGDWDGPFGLTLPAVVEHGVARTAANIDKAWIGTDVARAVKERTGLTATVVNDADAAGVAEATYGAAKGRSGLVLVLTLGTGIGSALLLDGRLVPNSELGHLELGGHLAESRASDAARSKEDLSWDKWAKRLTAYLRHVHLLLHPELVVLGGGVSKKSDKWLPLLDVDVEVVPAALLNDAGIIGAALLASR